MRPRPSLEIVAVCLATAMVLSWVVWAWRPATDVQFASLEANAHKASLAGIASRRTADSVTRIMTNRIAANRKVEARLSERLSINDSILSINADIASASRLNPADSSAAYTLYVALQQTTEVARLYRDSTNALLASVEGLLAAHEAERQANAAHVAAQDAVIAALKARECRILGLPCPSRKVTAAAGFLFAVVIP